MPELPEIQALAAFLGENAAGRRVHRVDLAALGALKTVTPPPGELHGRSLTTAGSRGKYLDLDFEGVHMVTHLSRAGWLRYCQTTAAAPPKLGRGPIALRMHLGVPGEGPGFDLTEAGTQKRLAIWITEDPQQIEQLAQLGPEATALGRDALAELLAGSNQRLKTVLTDQRIMAGIGNAYSDEIAHLARLSPYATAGSLTGEQLDALHAALQQVLTEARDHAVGQQAARLKSEKRAAMRVHARTGLPCPRCGETIREVSFATRALQYCPRCQTGGRVLADRRRSRLLR